MGRVEGVFKRLGKEHKKAFIVYIPFGFPNLNISKKILKVLDSSGVNAIDLGIPFSDPLADGPIIQGASNVALKAGVSVRRLFTTLEGIKHTIKTPLIILTYFNPVYNFGVERFLKKCKDSGVAGVMVVDLPLEEAHRYVRTAKRFDIDTIFFITPTTKRRRAKEILKISKGFVYYVSVTGTTGPKEILLKPLLKHLREIKKEAKVAVCVGFGIHTKKQAQAICQESDGFIVGSALVQHIEKHYKEKHFLKKLPLFIKKFYV